MSGVEVLGIVASVIQITQCAISITSAIARIYGTVEAAPARVQQGSEQLQRLLVTARTIRDNRVIQTENVEAHLAAIVTYANTLRGMLSRLASSSKKSIRRYIRVCLGNLEERQMIAQFDKIEKEKTALILSIVEVHSSFYHATLDTVRPMANQVDDMHQDMRSLTEILQQIRLENRVSITVTPTKCRLAERCGSDAASGRPKTLVGTSELSDPPTPEFEKPRPMHQSGNHYKAIQVRERAQQLNGNIGDPDHRWPTRNNQYEGIVATGCSLQLNGDLSSAAFFGSTFGK